MRRLIHLRASLNAVLAARPGVTFFIGALMASTAAVLLSTANTAMETLVSEKRDELARLQTQIYASQLVADVDSQSDAFVFDVAGQDDEHLAQEHPIAVGAGVQPQ